MRNYRKADLARIFRRKPRWVLIALLAVFAWFLGWGDPGDSSVQTIAWINNALKYMPAILGFIELGYVFGDDFKGKTAQIAIGIGVPRYKVVLVKWLEMVILGTVDTLFFAGLAALFSLVSGVGFATEMTAEFLISIFTCILGVAGYTAIILPILFMSQGTALAGLVYILFSSTLFFQGLSFLKYWQAVAWMHLHNYTLTNCLQVFRARLILGSMHWESVVGILLYLTLPMLLAQVLYKKLELEF